VSRGEDADRTLLARVAQGRAALREAGLPAGVASRLVVTQDDPVRALLDRAGPADVLVVGARSRGRLEGVITGSASRAILDRMSCDVMVVPPVRPPPQRSQQSWLTWPADPECAGTDMTSAGHLDQAMATGVVLTTINLP
jgi:hypothetical protein